MKGPVGAERRECTSSSTLTPQSGRDRLGLGRRGSHASANRPSSIFLPVVIIGWLKIGRGLGFLRHHRGIGRRDVLPAAVTARAGECAGRRDTIAVLIDKIDSL